MSDRKKLVLKACAVLPLTVIVTAWSQSQTQRQRR